MKRNLGLFSSMSIEGKTSRGLVEIDDCPATFLGDTAHGAFDHLAAGAGGRPKHISGNAMSVHADQNGCISGKIAAHQGHVRVSAIDLALVSDKAEITEAGIDRSVTNTLDVALVAQAIADEFRDGEHLEPMCPAEFDRIRNPRHGSVFLHDFA